MKKTDHYENINRFVSKALAHGVDSEETEKAIRRDAINKYVDEQIKREKVRLEIKTNDTLKNIDKSFILTITYGTKYIAYALKKATPGVLLKTAEGAINRLLQRE